MAHGAARALLAVAFTAAATAGGTSVATADSTSWSAPLAGEAAGVVVTDGVARLDPDRGRPGVASADGHGDARPPGLLTLPARRLDAPTDRVDAVITAAANADVSVDVRGLRRGGGWTEWEPAGQPSRPSPDSVALTVTLPEAVVQVQARLVLGPVRDATDEAPTDATPTVRGLTLTARPATRVRSADERRDPTRYRVFATREGLVGGTTANGHVIAEKDLFVALPSRRALAPRNTSDYAVKVCAPTGRCAFAPVWDVGPWNTRDDYWNPSDRRENWGDLARGVPEAQAAKTKGYNGGKDQFGREVRNPAGIDLADGLFWDALGLKDNAWVDVDYLWTGDSPLGTVRADSQIDLRGVDLHNAPDANAPVVGLAAAGASVPLECETAGWLQVGAAQFLPATVVAPAPSARPVPSCSR